MRRATTVYKGASLPAKRRPRRAAGPRGRPIFFTPCPPCLRVLRVKWTSTDQRWHEHCRCGKRWRRAQRFPAQPQFGTGGREARRRREHLFLVCGVVRARRCEGVDPNTSRVVEGSLPQGEGSL